MRRRLVSPFDVHATLRHLLSYPAPPPLPEWRYTGMDVRPRSLLATIPASRRCEHAGIPLDSCPCEAPPQASAIF